MIHLLNLPFRTRHPLATYDKQLKTYIYRGDILPDELYPYRALDFSYEQWEQERINGTRVEKKPSDVQFSLRDHQEDARKDIVQAYRDGYQGFLLADKTGLGKTLSTVAACVSIGEGRRLNILIVSPKGAIPQWRSTLTHYEQSLNHNVLITNYERLIKLLEEPRSAKTAKKQTTKNRHTATSGTPKHDWDIIVFDEAHRLKNFPTSQVSRAAVNVAKMNDDYRKDSSPFVISVTATPGSSPLHMSVYSPWLSLGLGAPRTVPPSAWAGFLKSVGFHIDKTQKGGYEWASLAWLQQGTVAYDKVIEQRRVDVERIGRALEQSPFLMRTHVGNEQNVMPLPVELSAQDMILYSEAWERFRRFLQMSSVKKDSKAALVENLRYRQKRSLLAVPSVVEFMKDRKKDDDEQFYVSCEFKETVAQYEKLLTKAGFTVGILTGETEDREMVRLGFQRGDYDVILCSVTSSISLHANEILPDGTKATSNPRVTIIHDIRQNSEEALQTLGRAHRDGENSLTYIPYVSGTIDEKIVLNWENKLGAMNTMLGDDDDMLAVFLDVM